MRQLTGSAALAGLILLTGCGASEPMALQGPGAASVVAAPGAGAESTSGAAPGVAVMTTGAAPSSPSSPSATRPAPSVKPVVRPGTGRIAKLAAITAPRPSPYDGGGNYGGPDDLYLLPTSATAAQVVSHNSGAHTLSVDTYSTRTWKQAGARRTISLAGWDRWGGIYAAPKGDIFVLVGRANPTQNDNLDVVAVRRYNAQWKLLGTGYVKGGVTQTFKGIYEPFAAAGARMLMVGSQLVVDMGRTMYDGGDGLHHQSDLMFTVSVPGMKTTVVTGQTPFSSHSFRQLLATSSSGLIVVQHGDAYPRAIQLGLMRSFPKGALSAHQILKIKGNVGDNRTGTTLDGVASGPSGVVVLGTSSNPAQAPQGPERARNVFAIAANPATGKSTLRWLSKQPWTGSASVGESRVVQVGKDRFVVLFALTGKTSRLEYRLLDSRGVVKATASFAGKTFFPGAQPILIGTQIVWVDVDQKSRSAQRSAYLHGLDISTPTKPIPVGRL